MKGSTQTFPTESIVSMQARTCGLLLVTPRMTGVSATGVARSIVQKFTGPNPDEEGKACLMAMKGESILRNILLFI